MENKKNSGLVLGVLIGIVMMLVSACILFATNTISLTSKVQVNDNQTNNVENYEKKDNEEVQNILNERIEKIFKYVHALSPYCGETEISFPDDTDNYDKDKYIVENWYTVYYVSEFSNKEEFNNYLKTFMTDEVIKKYSSDEKYTSDTYKESNGKLYCLNSNKDCYFIYDADKSNYTITDYTDDKIIATGKLGFHSCGDQEEYYNISIEIIKDSNNNWIVSKYEEE